MADEDILHRAAHLQSGAKWWKVAAFAVLRPQESPNEGFWPGWTYPHDVTAAGAEGHREDSSTAISGSTKKPNAAWVEGRINMNPEKRERRQEEGGRETMCIKSDTPMSESRGEEKGEQRGERRGEERGEGR